VAIRIDIDWDYISPALGVCSGILKIMEIYLPPDPGLVLLKIRCTAKHGSKGFKAIEEGGYSSIIFNKYEDQIKLMMDSYFQGMMLNKKNFYWIPSTLNQTSERIDYENLSKEH